MKEFIKNIISYDKIYNVVKTSFLYQAWKRFVWYMANFVYWYPSKDFFIIWVTWTNWKTTTVNIIHKMLNDTLW